MALYCTRCGKEHADSDLYCSRCGRELEYTAGTRPFTASHRYNDRYEIVRLVKSGAMGSLFEARDALNDSVVALKQMHIPAGDPQEEEQAALRFKHEALMLSQLRHPGLPQVIDYFEEHEPSTGKTSHFIVMTFIEGRDLEAIAREREQKSFPVDEALSYFMQLLDILEYLHSQDPPVIFRDLNPRNVIISGGKVFLVDFGIARTWVSSQRGTAIGTAGYAPPEQYKGEAEPRSDLFSLGVMMHYLLTGINPEDSSHKIFHFEQIGRINPDVPEHLDSLILSMLEVIPDRRPRSAAHVKAALSRKKPPSQTIGSKTRDMEQDISSMAYVFRKYSDVFETILSDDIDAFMAFLKAGIDVNAKNVNGFTPLHCACGRGLREVADMLIARYAEVNARSNRDWTPLHSAAICGHRELAELLIEKGALVNVEDQDGITPLHRASDRGFREIVELLILKGALVNAKNKKGDTPLHCASMRGHQAIVELLINKGARVNEKGLYGLTPLHLASLYEHRQIASLLISEGADVNMKDEHGNRPMQNTYRGEIKNLLRMHGGKGE